MVLELVSKNKGHKRHHYVPKGILKNFSIKDTSSKNAQVYVFDKIKQAVLPGPVNINKIAKENRFYDVKTDGVVKTIEESGLENLDDKASKVVEKIIEKKSIGIFSKEEKFLLSRFIMVQMLRTKLPRIAIVEYFKEKGFVVNEEKIKKLSIESIIDAEKTASYIYNKIWLLFKTSELKPFYISDHPVTFSGGPYRWDLGDTKGIELYFPISKTFCLVIFC